MSHDSSKHIKSSVDVAKQAVSSFKNYLKNTKAGDSAELLRLLNQLKNKILASRTTDSITRNAANCILFDVKPEHLSKTKHEITKRINYVIDHLNNSQEKIAEHGHKKIRKGMTVYVHDYSSAILNLLLKAKNQGTNFEVVTTEANPFLTGYAIATHLAKHNIPVTFFSDLAIRQALKRADIVLLDADALADNGKVYSEIGSELIADLAEKYDIPIYVCTDSWKISPSIVQEIESIRNLRPKEELWKKPPKGVTVLNYSYEKINPRLVTGIITEMGIYKPHYLISEVQKKYPWIK